MSWTSTICFLLGAYYLYSVINQMTLLMNPLYGLELTPKDLQHTVDPVWEKGAKFDLYCFLSASSIFPEMNLTDFSKAPKFHLVLDKHDLVFNESSTSLSQINDFEININITKDSVPSQEMWSKLQTNSTSVYLHILLVKKLASTNVQVIRKPEYESGRALHSRIQMIKYDKVPRSYRHRYLLADLGLVDITPLEQQRARLDPGTLITYWKPEVCTRLVSDWTKYPHTYVPDQISRHFVRAPRSAASNKLQYKPPIHADEIGLTSDKYVPLNSTVAALPLKISYSAMSLQRWLLMAHLEDSLKMQKESLQFSDKDMDDVRRLISDTPLSLLLVTIIASLLHLIFELLSFQSDIEFWRNNKSLAGLSVRAVCTDLVSQVVVFLFLVDQDASLLVTIPSFVAILIQVWKVTKATGLTVAVGYLLGFVPFPRVELRRLKVGSVRGVSAQSGETDGSRELNAVDPMDNETKRAAARREEKDLLLEKVTLEADRFATIHLSAVLVPLALGFIMRTLIFDKHGSWYSWAIGSLTGCVYAFGFVLMLPQLFINHKLKSVSHLPWNFLIFKFINTFIDDLFAFIIKMPTMHRLSVFRDDFVFIVYIYQRWRYQVDVDRPQEK